MKRFLLVILLVLAGFLANSQELLIPLNDDYEMEVQTAAYSSDYAIALLHLALFASNLNE